MLVWGLPKIRYFYQPDQAHENGLTLDCSFIQYFRDEFQTHVVSPAAPGYHQHTEIAGLAQLVQLN